MGMPSGDRTLNEPLLVRGGDGGVFLHVVAVDLLETLGMPILVVNLALQGVD